MLSAAATITIPLAVAAPATASAPPANVPKGAVQVKVTKIVAGDLVEVVPTRGATFRVRLLSIATPKRGQCFSNPAFARTKALLPIGKIAYLLRDRTPKDSAGNRLAYVWGGTGVFVNQNLVRGGWARVVNHAPNVKYRDLLRSEQAKAQRAKLGVWSVQCAPKPQVDPRFRTCKDANAKGYGPYRRGVDPEYAWYQDRDGDGIVCEPR
ncbi:thermonuclease family protein [Rhizohabitans arisaemae]|uniref:thermonuclease family protein n=1 Tax=Rhizohabitans arisaemae TaxID=2720610 RepID=UPI0024B054A8|nr:excalibur calcium-binding domain-containing protein [Rhizohabitans arisaemae]